ncbi:MAG TPA: alpha/beta fold hydrolase [Pyrinomonadaceae bacterium]|nr:alpha/beta fold hydrolase [Pyrinomonadaceae bacterium]
MTSLKVPQRTSVGRGINRVVIAYEDIGSGPVVVLLHGYPFNRSLWRDQVTVLQENYRVIVPDLRGHGASEIMRAPSTMELMAGDIAGLLDNLHIEQATIGGLSMGGYVALAFYRLFPFRVLSLILAATRAQADNDEAKQNRQVQAAKARREGMEGIADALLPKLLTAETVAKRPEIVKHLRGMMASTNPEGAAAALEGMAIRQDQTSFLPEILAPTLILVGSEDAITPPADAELMHREIRGSQLQVVERAGHVLNLERPEEFNAAVGRFLSGA